MIRPALPLQFGELAKAPTVDEAARVNVSRDVWIAQQAAASAMLAALRMAANWQTDTDPARGVTLRAIAQAEATGIKASS